MDGTRFIYKSCGALPALVQERADRLAALALLMGRSGTAVCVCVRVLGWIINKIYQFIKLCLNFCKEYKKKKKN